jgi:hypothetical protein
VTALLCVAMFVLVSVGIPLGFMRPYLRDQELHWPGYRLIERAKVAVGDGAFRDGQAMVEHHRDIPPGIPTGVKVTSFLAMYCGQLFPLLAMYAVLGMLTAVVFFAEQGMVSGLNILVAIIGTGLWAMSARSGWKASIAALSGQTSGAEEWLQKSVKWHLATLGAMGAAIVFASARSRELVTLSLTAPFFALAALAFLQQAMFRKHKSKLPDAVGEPALNAHGFTVLGVRVQTVADSPSAQVHESEVHAAVGDRGQGQR